MQKGEKRQYEDRRSSEEETTRREIEESPCPTCATFEIRGSLLHAQDRISNQHLPLPCKFGFLSMERAHDLSKRVAKTDITNDG